ncbi:MAG: formimidoylglutamate deiminase [Acidobacteriaceae bacterium]|nr:formimidoylglutamate deiminase [Acidobacteriaceae bacterium]
MSEVRSCPGLVSAHSHAFQRAIRGRTEQPSGVGQDTFWTWREAMYQAANRLSPEDIYDVSRMTFLEMALAGITAVGEFHYLHNAPDGTRYDDSNLLAKQVIRAATDVGLRIVLLNTAYVRGGQPRFLTPSIDDFIRDTEDLRGCSTELVSIGVAPHSVRAVPLDYLRGVIGYAQTNDLPIHMHVAEQPAEIEVCLDEYGMRPVELLYRNDLLSSSFTGVHVIHVIEDEIGYLAETGARVCACPTTERNLGDGAVPADRYFDRGVPVCLGSDSNVQIDILEDARELEYHLRMKRLERALLEPDGLFNSATQAGRESLKLPANKDYFTVDPNDPSIAGGADIVFSTGRSAIRDVYVNGRQLVGNGRHAQQDEIIARFKAVQKRSFRPN